MPTTAIVVGGIIFIALIFDYINGFHDAANSIATVVSTRVLTPGKAVLWAAAEARPGVRRGVSRHAISETLRRRVRSARFSAASR